MPDDQRVPAKSEPSTKEESAIALPRSSKRQKIGIVHDWLNGMRGGEIVFEAILDLFPEAEVFTLVYEPKKLSERLRQKLATRRVHTSWLNLFSWSRSRYRQLLPLLPFTIRQFDLYPFDLVISSSHCVAKGVRKHPEAKHVSYIHAPMRYMWGRFEEYFGKGRIHPLVRWIALAIRPAMQAWDRMTSSLDRIDRMISNSDFIAREVKQVYGRESRVIYPFARLERFNRPRSVGNFYLMVGAFAPYKRADLAVEAFARMGLPLKIVGKGQDGDRLMALQQRLNASNIEFIGDASDEQIESLYASCRAFVFPGEEDFGITPLEAMASGAPVIAYDSGGACETVTPETGVLFRPQTVDALVDAVMEIESGRSKFSPEACKKRAEIFNQERFKKEFLSETEFPR